jgi:hypothetical protein
MKFFVTEHSVFLRGLFLRLIMSENKKFNLLIQQPVVPGFP